LLAALGDPDAATRLAAIDALAGSGDEQAIKALGRLARDRAVVGDRQVGREAKAARAAMRARGRATSSAGPAS
jgi:hypothetical protein